ncbi:MAG: tRNA preQ1(34) S-adenosylmethionine ribosyltransferase-isomerase QueA [Nitrospirota bacterium]|nr:tRNA preQ1(34) S-adenosylmethionine ribosyltransferase-isomerase QueA [Nitrospirota bacterium]MDP2382960.1 tRNA preQ1(34) S-adenosylmethionine ribosyltransferase-isomerase QueA [Nitrospirota bacterium]MDP3597132.1 tRNA preQ1(34) S-adenosylmethionine ribosyltransferase-isomerase QueA [Nitrospirota bacterium]
MQLSEFDFAFDPSLIATCPVLPRDHAKLLVLQPHTQSLAHRRVDDLPELLQPGDLLVVNNTKVLAARVVGRKCPSGAEVEILFVKDLGDATWEVLIKGTFRPGQIIEMDAAASAEVIERDSARTTVRVESQVPFVEWLREHGRMPLPPYLKRAPTDQDREWYQTLFAQHEGAIAAPTAGLHFTAELLARLQQRGVGLTSITLHVGIGTFKPVKVDHIEDHQMGTEWIDVGAEAVRAIEHTRAEGGRIVAVGTTAVRALETAARADGQIRPYRGETDIFMTPGFSFKVIDALFTNFHLPRTTLLMLVSALAGTEFLREAYAEAVRERYRFYSYGDAMLIL